MVTKEKKIYLEIIRLIAIFMVLYEHTGDRARWHYETAGSMPSYWLGIAMACICVMCNYIFFSVSGAVLLHKEEKIKILLKKRFLPMAIVFAVFTFIQYLLSYLANPIVGFGLKSYIHILYSYEAINQYWFFRAYLMFLLILPFLRFLVKGMKKQHYFYLFGLYILVEGILPVFEFVCNFPPNKFSIPMLDALFIYPLLGYFIEHVYGDELQKKPKLIFINVVGIAAFVMFMAETHILQQYYGQFEEIDGLTFLMVAMLMIDVRWICSKIRFPRVLKKVLLFAGAGVFGVYLLEPQVRGLTQWIYDGLVSYITWFGATLVWLPAAMVIGILFMNLLKRIPLIKKLF